MNLRLTLTSVVVLALTIGSGVIHGRITHRWSSTNQAAVDLTRIPTSFGEWEMVQEQDVSEEVLNVLKAESSIFRIYKNKDEQFISMAVIAGPCGPVSVHIPEICYSSQEYQRISDRKRMLVGSSSDGDEYWSLEFATKDVDAAPLTVCYAWSDGGTWEAPDDARHYFAGTPRLFKLQLAAPSADRDGTSDPCADFLKEFIAHNWPMNPPSHN